jgi:hypothetical protein
MRKYIVLFLLAMIVLPSCYHSPTTSWTPRRSKAIRQGKSAKADKKSRTVRMW